MIIFLNISLSICLGCSKEPSHGDHSFKYPQHFLIRKLVNYNAHFSGVCDHAHGLSYLACSFQVPGAFQFDLI